MTADVIKYAELPNSKIYLSQLYNIVKEIKNLNGFKLIAGRFMKIIKKAALDNAKELQEKNDIKIDITDHIQEFIKISKQTDALWGYIEDSIDERKRLARMGIESVEELRAYLREYYLYRYAGQSVDPKQKAIKQLERKYRLEQKGDVNFTPKDIVLEMIELTDIDSSSRVLEPSAGIGYIADEVRKITENVDCIEWCNSYSELLKLKGHNVVGNDFLKFEKANYYDTIIMNPPFSNNSDIIHLKHAYNILKTGGKLVCITSRHWTFAEDKKSQEFREWFSSMDGQSIELEAGVFEMTNVRTNIVVISKGKDCRELAG